MMCKGTRKTPERQVPLNPEIQIFGIFTLVPIIVLFQGETKLNKLQAYPKKFWIWHYKQKLSKQLALTSKKYLKHFSELKIILQKVTTKNQLRVIEDNICNIERKKCMINCGFTLLHYVFLEIPLRYYATFNF